MVIPTLYQHVNNTDVAAEVLKFVRIPGKPYARVTVCWWNVVPTHTPYCLNLTQRLTDSSIQGNKQARQKYPLTRWYSEWRVLTSNRSHYV